MTRFRPWLRPVVLAGLLLAGGGARAAAQQSLGWAPCATGGDAALECASLELPLDHAAPDGETISIGLRRVRGSGEGVRQLWYLAGGPGDAVGGALGRVADILADPGLDVYGVDHRGTGASADLRCPLEESPDSPDGSEITSEEWPTCVAYITDTRDDLDWLTVTQSAYDLGAAIKIVADEAERAGGARPRAFVFGASFGSFWANRYLQLFPDQPAGVILDGIVPADWSFAEFDASLDGTARVWLARCGADAECGARLGEDPAATIEGVLARLDDGHCPALGVDARTARILMGVVLMVDDIPNGLIPAMAYRWDRCAWQDQMALTHFIRVVLSGVGEGAFHSPVLQRHVAMSEIWNETDPSAESLERALAETVATTEVSASFAATYADWPRYPADSLDGRQAEYDGPLLLLHGGLDPTMPVERLAGVRAAYTGAVQTFAVIPEAGHVTINYSECARAMYRTFLTDPEAELDVGCIADERFASLEIDGPTSTDLFGTADLWGDDVSFLATAWFRLRYNLLPILTGLVGLVLLGRMARRGKTGRRRAILALAGVAFVGLGTYVLTASTPLLIDYRGAAATTAVFAVVLVQVLLTCVLVRWAGRSVGAAAR
ncbi:MAG: serine aminopeptidase domain-containing protein [Gemmatimonadota bacterium]